MQPQEEAQLLEASKMAVAASLAGGIIAASGRGWTIHEAQELAFNIRYNMYPVPGNGQYEQFAVQQQAIVTKRYGPDNH